MAALASAALGDFRAIFFSVKKKTLVTELTPSSRILRGFRRATVIAIIVSVALAALIGIITVFVGTLVETQGRILGTTSLVAGISITALCHLAIAGRKVRVMGFGGLAASIVAGAAGVAVIWGFWSANSEIADIVLKTFALAGILAVFLAQANLLLLLASRRRRAILVFLNITLATIAVLYGLVVAAVLTDGYIVSQFRDDLYIRTLAVVAILDALGTIVVPVLGAFIREKKKTDGLVTVTLHLPKDSADLLTAWTTESGQSPEDVVGALLLLGSKI